MLIVWQFFFMVLDFILLNIYRIYYANLFVVNGKVQPSLFYVH